MFGAEAVALARAVASGAQDAAAGAITAELLICPTALHIAAVADVGKDSPVAVGGQDCHQAKQGAHTGDIAAPMLRDAGASWVILGHSERRQNHGETDELVREKSLAAVEAGLIPIICVGETSDQRASGQETEIVGWQIAGSLPKPFTGVLAYEPVWAIGTGRNATEEDVGGHARLHSGRIGAPVRRRQGRPSGSCMAGRSRRANAAALLAVPNVGGALVGGASLKAEDFLAIARAADSVQSIGCRLRRQGSAAARDE